jgi:hypothetical protein
MEEDDFAECALCDNLFLTACLSDEGEDGMLCNECGRECPTCDAPVQRNMNESNHMDKCVHCDIVYCPLETKLTVCINCKQYTCNKHNQSHTCVV